MTGPSFRWLPASSSSASRLSSSPNGPSANAPQFHRLPSRARLGAQMRSLVAICLILLSTPEAWGDEIVDLELALAVDASGSVDDGEFALQLVGIASGFARPRGAQG